MLNRLVRTLAPALVLAALPVASFAGVAIGVSINIAPPALPVYVQPAPPGPDYIWTPGYWAWGDDGYYWVPGTWVIAPAPGLLWTPGYWGWVGGAYIWHTGYWGPHIGFYGGVNYGFGYGGVGYEGAYWRGGHVVYNRAVTNVTNINVTNVYNKTVVVNNVSHVSFNGGSGGIMAHASAAQLAAEHEHHFEPTSVQREHVNLASHDHNLRAAVNMGHPRMAATARPASFGGHGEGAHNFDRPAAQMHNRPQEHNAPHMGGQPHMAPTQHAEPHMAPAQHAEAHMAPAQHAEPRMAQGHPGGQPHFEQPHGQPRGEPHGQPHNEGPRGGGGRPEGHGQQNRFR